MHHYSHNNHYRWGWNGEWFNKPQAEGYFNVSIGACNRQHMSFREECIHAATLLGKSFTKPILVGLSGGMDSQVVCLSLMKAGIPFQPVILKLYSDDGRIYNDFDIEGVLIDSMSMQYLSGATIDYKESEYGSQFTIVNPNATTTCGCGSSFSV